MIRAVVFDFRHTLLRVDRAYKKSGDFLLGFVRKQGISMTAAEFHQHWTATIQAVIASFGRPTHIHDWVAISLAAFLKRIEVQLSTSAFHQLNRQYERVFVRTVSLYPDARVCIQYLKKHNIKLAVVIDGTRRRERAILKRLKLDRAFDAIIISEEVGSNKFSSLPLQRAIKRLGIPTRETLVVGDRIDKDIVHANRLGCISVKLERHAGRYTSARARKAIEQPQYVIHGLRELAGLVSKR